MQNLKTLKADLQKRLEGAGSIAVLGVGSELRGDDAAGCMVAEGLTNTLQSDRRRVASPTRNVRVFQGATAPENLTGEIIRFKPAHVVIVDAADLGLKAGAVALMDAQAISGVSFCTHQLPMKILADYLSQSIGCRVTVIGIQPKRLDFGSEVSPEARKAVAQVSGALKAAINARVSRRRKSS